ncbi:MAG TPA: TauD/TfdA family dioxygenase [Blastocatellia bacterium]|nr:TauD/TfdA family dioxygenase [Blastocatellia bacterium]
MDDVNRRESHLNEFKSNKRKAVRLSPEDLIKMNYLDPEKRFPLVIEPQAAGLDPVGWAESNRELIERQLLAHGALLFRGFRVDGVTRFEQLACAVSGELLDYRERAAPRTEIASRVYTSTEFPADQSIPLHHEMSYSHNWPTKLWFFCVQPAQQGGSTPIANDREVINLIDPKIKERFLNKGIMYVRNYGEGLDMSWQVAFQTEDRSVVEEYCRRAGTQFEWRANDRLRTRQKRQVTVTHPKTGETIWFNHAHLFHLSNLTPEVREALLSEFKEDELPRNAFYGDGSPIESSILDEIRDVYQRSAVIFPWQQGDILMLDNFLASHGREPFVGPRQILVAMAELYTAADVH